MSALPAPLRRLPAALARIGLLLPWAVAVVLLQRLAFRFDPLDGALWARSWQAFLDGRLSFVTAPQVAWLLSWPLALLGAWWSVWWAPAALGRLRRWAARLRPRADAADEPLATEAEWEFKPLEVGVRHDPAGSADATAIALDEDALKGFMDGMAGDNPESAAELEDMEAALGVAPPPGVPPEPATAASGLPPPAPGPAMVAVRPPRFPLVQEHVREAVMMQAITLGYGSVLREVPVPGGRLRRYGREREAVDVVIADARLVYAISLSNFGGACLRPDADEQLWVAEGEAWVSPILRTHTLMQGLVGLLAETGAVVSGLAVIGDGEVAVDEMRHNAWREASIEVVVMPPALSTGTAFPPIDLTQAIGTAAGPPPERVTALLRQRQREAGRA